MNEYRELDRRNQKMVKKNPMIVVQMIIYWILKHNEKFNICIMLDNSLCQTKNLSKIMNNYIKKKNYWLLQMNEHTKL